MNIVDLTKDVFSVTDVGLKRKENEDSCSYLKTINGYLFVVCDGIGGHIGGATASSIAVSSTVDFFNKEKYTNLEQALIDSIVFSNRNILNAVVEKPELKGMGTTICILLVHEDRVLSAHVGDSRIYLFNSCEQKLHRLTKDHSVVQALVDKGEISESEAESHPQRNKILRALGIKQAVHPDVINAPLFPATGDIFVLCTDGLSCMVNDDILQQILTTNISLYEKGTSMLLLANQAGGVDNITIQLVQISNSPHQQSGCICNNVEVQEDQMGKTVCNENFPQNMRAKSKLKTILLISGIVLLALGTLILLKLFL
jgi:protein phosphatase